MRPSATPTAPPPMPGGGGAPWNAPTAQALPYHAMQHAGYAAVGGGAAVPALPPPPMPGGVPMAAMGTGRSPEAVSLFMGELEPHWTEEYLTQLFSYTGQVINARIGKHQTSGARQPFGFINFASAEAANLVLQTWNGRPIPGAPGKTFKLGWGVRSKSMVSPGPVPAAASLPYGYGAAPGYGVAATPYGMPATHGYGSFAPPAQHQPFLRAVPAAQRGVGSDRFAVFVGQLANDVSTDQLTGAFRYYYPSVTHAKVVPQKGFGFVYFGLEEEQRKALTEMNGFVLNNRPITVNQAQAPRDASGSASGAGGSGGSGSGGSGGGAGGGGGGGGGAATAASRLIETEPGNRTIFIGGVDDFLTQDVLRGAFQHFGHILQVKVPPGRNCAFIEFADHMQARQCIETLGAEAFIGAKSVRINWGKIPSSAAVPALATAGTAAGAGSVFADSWLPSTTPSALKREGPEPGDGRPEMAIAATGGPVGSDSHSSKKVKVAENESS